jgi:hypothetical protein
MRFRLASLLVLLLAIPAFAASHTASITYTASSDSSIGTPGTVTIYRAVGACPASGLGSLTFAQVTSTAPAGGPYTDTLPGVGTYCYYATATISGATSIPSNTGGGSANPFPPTTFTVTVQ